METTNSSMSSQQPQLPPGFRFHPTDEELVVHYLKKKADSIPLPVAIIAEIDLYKFDPWELPDKALFGEQEWYFFTPRDRKYPNGARPNRAATSGYWKATGIDKPVFTAGGREKVGVKKALVFYGGKPPKGVKTNWIMHEYRLTDHHNNNNKSIFKPPAYDPAKNKGSLRLDDWVLCRIYKKSNMQRSPAEGDGRGGGDLTGILASPLPCRSYNHHWFMRTTGGCTGCNATVENHEHDNVLFNMLNSNSGDNNHLHMTTTNLFPASSSAYTKTFLPDSNLDRSPMTTQPSTATMVENNGSMLQQQTMLLDPGESIFRQQYQLPGMNWFS